MPAYDDSSNCPGKGGSALNRGASIKARSSPQPRRKVTPLKTPSPITDLHHRRMKRKRSEDRLASEKASKKSRHEGQLHPGQKTEIIDLTGDDDDPVKPPLFKKANGSAGLIRDTTAVDLTSDSEVNTVASPLRGYGPASRSRDVKAPITPMPKRKKKLNPIFADSEDESEETTAFTPRTPARKTANPGAVDNEFGLVTPGTPMSPRAIAQPRRRRPLPSGGPALPGNLSSPGQAAMPLTPAHVRMQLMSEMPYQQDDGLPAESPRQAVMPPTPAHVRQQLMSEMPYQNDGLPAESPGAFGAQGPPPGALPAHDAAENISRALARTSLSKPRAREAAQNQPRRRRQPAPRVVGRRRAAGSRKTAVKAKAKAKAKAREKPPRPSRIVVLRAHPRELLRISQRPKQQPDIPARTKCFLLELPLEVQHNIFKYLLLADDPIRVLRQWSQLYHKQRSGLHPNILQTCRAMFNNGVDYLYGENVFRYMVRDTHKDDAPRSSRFCINVRKYMRLFRKLELQIERSRTEIAYCTVMGNAVAVLCNGDVNLETLTIVVSPIVEGQTVSVIGYLYKNGPIIQALKALPVRYIELRVFPPPKIEDETEDETEDDNEDDNEDEAEDEPAAEPAAEPVAEPVAKPKIVCLVKVFDMRPEAWRFDKGPMKPPADQLDDIADLLSRACENPSKVVEEGLFQRFEVVPRKDDRHAGSSPVTYHEAGPDDGTEGPDGDDGDSDYQDSLVDSD